MDKYKKLTEDLRIAAFNATVRAAHEDDGGTCNFDSLAISLPRWKEELVLSAAEQAGVRAHKTEWFGKPFYMFSVPVASQGNRRTIQAEAMREYMKSCGYEATVYYQMD